MADTSHRDYLDWENLAGPVPMNLIDSDFPEAAEESPALPGSRSEILPRETAESLMAPPEPVVAAPEDTAPVISEPAASEPAETAAVSSDNDTDVFSGMRAQVEAQAAAEDEAKLKAEQEESDQRQRLEQWMANARARLQAADQEPQVPGVLPRVRREPSPSLIRLAEMQKTMLQPGDAEAPPDPENGSGYKTGKISLDGSDPMATIIVPKDTFVEAPDTRTGKLRSLERKVAQIKQMEAGAETMIMAAPVAEPEKANVRVAIWVLGGLIPVVLGLGLFALLKTGYLEGIGDLFPTLAGRPSHVSPKPVRPEPRAVEPAAETAGAAEAARATETAGAEAADAETPARAQTATPVPTALPTPVAPPTPVREPIAVAPKAVAPKSAVKSTIKLEAAK